MECFFLNPKMERVWQRDDAHRAEASWDMRLLAAHHGCRSRQIASPTRQAAIENTAAVPIANAGGADGTFKAIS